MKTIAEKAQEIARATECECGWVMPPWIRVYPLGVQVKEGNEVPRVFVALLCPMCGAGHTLYNPDDPESIAACVTKNEELLRRQS